MKQLEAKVLTHEVAPQWAEQRLPVSGVRADVPSVLLIRIPDENSWIVASRLATDCISNPNSFLGGFIRSHCKLMGVHDYSNN